MKEGAVEMKFVVKFVRRCGGLWSIFSTRRKRQVSRSYQLVPGAGWRLVDLTDWMWPVSGATCTAPRFEATYLLRRRKWISFSFV